LRELGVGGSFGFGFDVVDELDQRVQNLVAQVEERVLNVFDAGRQRQVFRVVAVNAGRDASPSGELADMPYGHR